MRNLFTVFRGCVAIGLVLAAGSCVTVSDPDPLVLSPSRPVATKQVPWHTKAALSALILRLRGASEAQVGREARTDASGAIKPESGFRYQGFAARQIKIAVFATPEDQPAQRILAGYLHFQDAAGRRAAAAFRLNYAIAGDRIAIAKAAWAPLFAKYPKTEMFIVPEQLPKPPATTPKDYPGLYALVGSNAVPMSNATAPGTPRDYLIAVFVKDRIAPGAKFQVGISEVRAGTAAFKEETRIKVLQGGWAVAVIPGTFSLSPDGAFWIKATHTPGRDVAADQRTERLVGLFSTAPTAAKPKTPRPKVPAGPPNPLKATLTGDSNAAEGSPLDREIDQALRKARGTVAPGISSERAAPNQTPLPRIVYQRRTAKGS
jgi:hypothetical protein